MNAFDEKFILLLVEAFISHYFLVEFIRSHCSVNSPRLRYGSVAFITSLLGMATSCSYSTSEITNLPSVLSLVMTSFICSIFCVYFVLPSVIFVYVAYVFAVLIECVDYVLNKQLYKNEFGNTRLKVI